MTPIAFVPDRASNCSERPEIECQRALTQPLRPSADRRWTNRVSAPVLITTFRSRFAIGHRYCAANRGEPRLPRMIVSHT